MDNIKSFEEYHNLDEANTNDKDFNNLIKTLDKAKDAAKKLGQIMKKNPVKIYGQDAGDYWDGTEGNVIAIKLRQIWNAFSTGNEFNNSDEDEIFK